VGFEAEEQKKVADQPGGNQVKAYDSTYVVLGALWLVIGMILGIVMGASHNFGMTPIHAHINLVGFACHSIFGLMYRQWPAMKSSGLAALQFWIFVLATPITLVGLYFTLTGGPELPTIIGSLGLLLGAILFLVMIWRARNTSG
jgi:hypothetical protein